MGPGPAIPMSLGDLDRAAELVLATYVSELTALGVTLPKRQYVAPGAGSQGLAVDGEQLNVALASIQQGKPGAANAQTVHPSAVVYFAQWAVLIWRPVPALTGNSTGRQSIPAAGKLDQAGRGNMLDIAALVNAATQIHRAGTFGPVGVGEALDGARGIGPEGGMVGAQLLFSVSLQ